MLYTKQKLLKFREHVEIFTDSSRATHLADIRANKVIDWSARYTSTDASGREIGAVGRKGRRSIWRAHYEAFNPGDNNPDFTIREEMPSAKGGGGCPARRDPDPLACCCGYFFQHPLSRHHTSQHRHNAPTKRFFAGRADDDNAGGARAFEGRFKIDKLSGSIAAEEMNLQLSYLNNRAARTPERVKAKMRNRREYTEYTEGEQVGCVIA